MSQLSISTVGLEAIIGTMLLGLTLIFVGTTCTSSADPDEPPQLPGECYETFYSGNYGDCTHPRHRLEVIPLGSGEKVVTCRCPHPETEGETP